MNTAPHASEEDPSEEDESFSNFYRLSHQTKSCRCSSTLLEISENDWAQNSSEDLPKRVSVHNKVTFEPWTDISPIACHIIPKNIAKKSSEITIVKPPPSVSTVPSESSDEYEDLILNFVKTPIWKAVTNTVTFEYVPSNGRYRAQKAVQRHFQPTPSLKKHQVINFLTQIDPKDLENYIYKAFPGEFEMYVSMQDNGVDGTSELETVHHSLLSNLRSSRYKYEYEECALTPHQLMDKTIIEKHRAKSETLAVLPKIANDKRAYKIYKKMSTTSANLLKTRNDKVVITRPGYGKNDSGESASSSVQCVSSPELTLSENQINSNNRCGSSQLTQQILKPINSHRTDEKSETQESSVKYKDFVTSGFAGKSWNCLEETTVNSNANRQPDETPTREEYFRKSKLMPLPLNGKTQLPFAFNSLPGVSVQKAKMDVSSKRIF